MGNTPGFTPLAQQAAGATPGFTPLGGAPTQPTAQATQPSTGLGKTIYATKRFGTGMYEEAKGLGRGLMQAATPANESSSFTDRALQWASNITGAPLLAAKKAFVDPAIAKGQSTAAAFRQGDYAKGALGAAATVNPFAPDVTKLYEQAQGGDTAGAAGRGVTDTLAMLLADGRLKDHVSQAAKVLDRQIAINKGRVGMVNDAANSAHILENAVTGPTGEVGKHAQAVIAADKLDLAQSGSEGKVNTAPATAAAQAVIDKTKMGGVAGGFKTMMTMDEAKATMTQIGREASKFERAGKAPEAAASWAEYDGLRKATQERADALGAQFGRSWQHYSTEFHNLVQMKKGIYGNLLEVGPGDHPGLLKKLTSGDHAAEIGEIKEAMQKYKVNPEPIDYAIKNGKTLDDLTQQAQNFFAGKIRAISRHKIAAPLAIVGGSAAATAIGLPAILSHVAIPLIIAGKVGGLLDAMQARTLLKEISAKVGPEMQRVTPSFEGPQPLPEPPTAGATQPPSTPSAPGGPGGVERRLNEGESPTGEERRQVMREASQQVQANLRPAPRTQAEADAEIQRQLDEIVPEYMRKPPKSELAGKLQSARKSKGK